MSASTLMATISMASRKNKLCASVIKEIRLSFVSKEIELIFIKRVKIVGF